MTSNQQAIANTIILLYNTDNANPISVTDYNFGLPLPNTNVNHNRNTVLILTPKAELGGYGAVSIYYNRIDFNEIDAIFIPKGLSIATSDLYLAINEEYGVGVYAEDIVPEVLTNAASVIIKASPSSLMFKGNALVTFV